MNWITSPADPFTIVAVDENSSTMPLIICRATNHRDAALIAAAPLMLNTLLVVASELDHMPDDVRRAIAPYVSQALNAAAVP